MLLQAVVESKEAKGYILNLGFKDHTKGFLKFSEGSKGNLKTNQPIQIQVKSVIEASKVVKCE